MTQFDPKDTLNNISPVDNNIDEEYTKSFFLGEREKVEIDGIKQFIKLRMHWSWSIIVWISTLTAFHIFLVIGVGRHWLDFTTNQWIIPSVITEHFLQIVGMGIVVTKFLYPKKQL